MIGTLNSIGIHFIVGLEGPTLGATEKRALKELSPLGIIIFKHNIDSASRNWVERLNDLMKRAQELADREHFVCSIDHEGGKVNRLPEPFTHFPAPAVWASHATEVGTVMGVELAAVGFNLNYAPLLDVRTEPKNTIIQDRAFSKIPEEVAAPAKKFLLAMRKYGVEGCAKHFPGHGRTVEDSHLELPALRCSKEELAQCELKPYEQLLDELQLIMTAHVCYTALDPQNPATTSKAIVNELLRGSLGYTQAVISDALEMSALANYSTEEATIRTLEAGVDLLLLGQLKKEAPIVAALRCAEALHQQAEKNDNFASQLDKSTQRIEAFSSCFVGPLQRSLDEKCIGTKEHQELNKKLRND